jgi:hypothetical protein
VASALKTAFDALTPGWQRGYILYFAAPKQSKTRESRVEFGRAIHRAEDLVGDSCATVKKIGLTRRCSEPPTSSAIYGYGKFEPQHCVLNAHRPAVAELER